MLLKALKNIATLAIVLLALTTMFAAWSARMSPTEAGKLCLVWFAFPYMWLAVVAAGVVCFAFKGWFQFFCCLVAAGTTWGSARQVVDIPLSGDDEEGGIKILTYNVHYMSYSSEMSLTHTRDSICSFLLDADADIVCLQEAPRIEVLSSPQFAGGLGERLLAKYPFRLTGSDTRRGQLILSKHKMEEAAGTRAKFDMAQRQGAIVAADIFVGDDTVRVVNCHLASLALSDREIEAVSSERDDDGDREARLKQTYRKMMTAFAERQLETSILKKVIGSTSTGIIVCGDFNDTPISHTYHTLTSDPRPLADSRHPRRVGLAKTYRGALPPLRIDYIMMSEGMKAHGYAEHDLPTSDHKAVSASIAL